MATLDDATGTDPLLDVTDLAYIRAISDAKRAGSKGDLTEIRKLMEIRALDGLREIRRGALSFLRNPPADPTGKPINNIDPGPAFTQNNEQVMAWEGTAITFLLTSLCNVVTALRAEVSAAFMEAEESGLDDTDGWIWIFALESGGFGGRSLFGRDVDFADFAPGFTGQFVAR